MSNFDSDEPFQLLSLEPAGAELQVAVLTIRRPVRRHPSFFGSATAAALRLALLLMLAAPLLRRPGLVSCAESLLLLLLLLHVLL